MLEIRTVFEILPIKPDFNKKQVKKAGNKLLARYKPDKVRRVKPDELKDILMVKYREVFKLANDQLTQIKKGNLNYNTPTLYDEYINSYKQELKNYNESDFIIILKANDLPTDGNKTQLLNRILENVPSVIASLNLEQDYLEDVHKPKPEDILKDFRENKLVRILQLKNIRPNGNSTSLINQIVSNISEDELNNLIEQVDREIDELKDKLNGLREEQLKLILDNNNFNSRGNKNVLINKIIENLPIGEIENNINRVRINKQKALEKLYSITGKDELSESYKQKLATKHLDINHGITIRNKIVSLINNYKIEENNIESKLNELINKQSKQIIDNTINELYKITGKTSINPKFLKKLQQSGLDKNDGVQIRNEIIVDIKAWKVGKDNLSHYANLKIKQKKLIKQNEKIEILYGITGKTTISPSFTKLLSDHGLNNQDGIKIRNELINIIKTTNINKNEINPKVLELITLTASEKLINECDINYLNQIAIINNLSKCNSKQKYVESFLNSISPSFNDLKIKSDINEIDNIKEKLAKLYKNQLEFILVSNNISSSGTKNELIDKIISNINIRATKLIISEIDKVNVKLNQLTMNELSFILKENNIIIAGGKTQVINEINKTLPVTTIKNNIKQLSEVKSQLKELNTNELKFIAKSNNLIVIDNKERLIDEIGTQVPVYILAENISEISKIKISVQSFNKLQRQHLLISAGLNKDSDDETQINEILENVDLFEITDFNKRILELKEELNNLSVIQLNYILDNHNLEIKNICQNCGAVIQEADLFCSECGAKISIDTSIQIETILENILMPLIIKDIQSIKRLENKINAVSEDEIDNILSENKLRKSIDKNENIKTIFKNLSFDEINAYLSGTKIDVNLIDEIKDSLLICPIKISKGKPKLTTEKHGNSRFLLLFDNEESFNEYKMSNPSVKKLEKDLNCFKKLINNDKRIEGIFIRNTPIKKNQLNIIS